MPEKDKRSRPDLRDPISCEERVDVGLVEESNVEDEDDDDDDDDGARTRLSVSTRTSQSGHPDPIMKKSRT